MIAVVGVVVMAAGLCILIADVPGLNTTWFLWAWVGWLLVVDGLISLSGGASYVLRRRRELGAMLLWSVPFWCIFEAYNLVIENWYYVFLPRSETWQGLFAFAAFATVLPACFFHAELLRARRWFEQTRSPLPVRGPVEWFVGGFGAACIVLPLLFPRQCFWMVWGALLGVPAVITYRIGAPSLLRELEQGRPGRLLRLLLGGLWAGGMWEGMNFWARTKWVYTVPGFEEWKLFEMPLLGFVGFPFLALEAAESYALWCWIARNGRDHRLPDAGQPGVPLRMEVLQIAALVAFSLAAAALPLDPAVMSTRAIPEELRGQPVASVEALVGQVEAGHRQPGVAYRHADLALHKGMGAAHAGLLLDAGITGPEALADAVPTALHARLVPLALAASVPPPRLAQVRVWVRAAQIGRVRRR